MIGEWWIGKGIEGSGRAYIKVLSHHIPAGFEENREKLSKNNRFPGRDLNPIPTEYDVGVSSTRP
jgi:hypothetical protein